MPPCFGHAGFAVVLAAHVISSFTLCKSTTSRKMRQSRCFVVVLASEPVTASFSDP
ncbi:hypothetical protein P152DRAFT_231259 [Eremomyces bilateralis CBS 781.70]|uniref:Uncharacterized protein n=1 Tax=Eremomyces bilateralis CBS 781.70 TaxID=1392243 RepID=A0A6G1G9P4_9PEZI|nr:uncharacterized protein P152DRAFT_231259 [Eremomyces bilateralis CBS 781.70]KAF1814744.1 hypothetical protein P152DRAFT_231259 [Eremomyces bilateralis CBS 781.70]